MVELARARAEELGLSDVVEAKAMEAEWIDLSAAAVDAVLCRWGYMLLADPETALRETRRVLKPGGRLALAVWDRAEDNPGPWGGWSSGSASPNPTRPAPRGPSPSATGERLAELLAAAGWVDDVEIDAIDFAFTAPDADTWWQQQLDCSLSLNRLTASLSPADHYRLRDAVDAELAAYAEPDGSLRLPARTLVAAASA
jgi:SAM-dependent methyltransferase